MIEELSNCCKSAVKTQDKGFHYIFVCTKCEAPCNLQGELIIPNIVLKRTKPFEPITTGKPNCKHHLDHIPNYKGTLEQLANDIGDLKYNKLEEFLGHLEKKLRGDKERDKKAGRRQLALRLEYAIGALSEFAGHIKRAWRICEPYMNVKS